MKDDGPRWLMIDAVIKHYFALVRPISKKLS
jgi:hypothetical protein